MSPIAAPVAVLWLLGQPDCCERSFTAALDAEGMILAQGDRRDFLVVYEGGGYLTLGKKLLGETAAQVRNKLADIDRAQLPTLEQAREQMLGRDLAAVTHQIAAAEAEQQPAPVWDRDAASREWEEKLVAAAIELGNTAGGGREKTTDGERESDVAEKASPPPSLPFRAWSW